MSSVRAGRPATVALDIVIPVHNEETDLRPAVLRLHEYLSAQRAAELPDHHRRQRVHRRDRGDRRSARCRDARGAQRPPGARRAAAARSKRSGPNRTPRCSRTWTSTCPPIWPRCCRWSRRWSVRPFRPGDRHPAAPRIQGGPRPQAGVHLPLLQPRCCAAPWPPGSPTPNAGSRRSGRDVAAAAVAARRRTPGGSSTPNC